MKKFLKLLCYSLITVFLLGLGGEKVFAAPQTFTAQRGVKWIVLSNWNSTVKTAKETGAYVFCLDSEKNIYTDGSMSLITFPGVLERSYLSGYQETIKSIMTRAYRLGYTEKKDNYTFTIEGSQYTVSNTNFYGIIQAAVWKAAHGSGDDGYLQKYAKWISDNGFDEIFKYLTTANDNSYYLTLDYIADSGYPAAGEFDVDGTNWVSGQYKLNSNAPSTTTFQISVSNGGSIQVKSGDSWVSSDASSLHIGDIIRIVRPYNSSSDDGQLITTTLNVTSSDVVLGTDIYLYYPTGSNDKNNKYQNLVYPEPKIGNLSATMTVNGTHESVKQGQIKVAKVDNNGTPIAGARMILYYKDGNKNKIIQEFTTINGYITFNNVLASSEIENKDYCLQEIKAPDGYVMNSEPLCKPLADNDSLTLTIINVPQRLQFRKTDMQGNPIAGVRLEVHGYVDETLAGKDDYPYFCGITDEQGYLTQPCTDVGDNSGTTARIVNPVNGTFPISLDEHLDGIYYIKEYFKEGFYNPSLDDDWMDFGIFHRKENSADFDEDSFGLQYAGRKAQTYLQLSGVVGKDPVVTVNVLNSRYVKFTKTDTGTGNEIAGAEMILEDLNVEDYSMGAPIARRVDEWISDGTPHYFTEAMIGHKYRLKETVAPADHVKLETTIEFTIDENGKVVLSEGTPTQVKLSDDPNIDLDRWIIVGNDMVINPPNTGISLLNKIAIGCLSVFVGYEVIKIYRKKANS